MFNGVDVTLEQPQTHRTSTRGSGRTMEPRILDCSKPFDPREVDGSNWVDAEIDERYLSLTQVDFATTRSDYVTCLGDHALITGHQKLELLKKRNVIRYGGQQLGALMRDFQERGLESVLEWLWQRYGWTYIDFFGQVLTSPHLPDHPFVLCLRRRPAKGWILGTSYLDSLLWDARRVTAVGKVTSC